MSDYARNQPALETGPALLRPVVYFRISAFALLAVALLGLVMNLIEGNYSNALGFGDTFLNFTYSHDVLHFVLAAAAFTLGFANVSPSLVKGAAILFGAVYLALGIAGFFVFNAPHDTSFLALTPALNAVHILLGGYALTSGLMAKA